MGADAEKITLSYSPNIDTNISPIQEEITTENDSQEVDSSITEPASADSTFPQEVANDTISETLPIDDTEFPYAGIPRIVIETENYREIKDRETEISAKLQI